MPQPIRNDADKNTQAIFVGLFLVILIAAVTLFRSDALKKDPPAREKSTDPSQAASAEPTINKTTSAELAKALFSAAPPLVLDLRDQSAFDAEHIIDSIDVAKTTDTEIIRSVAKSKTCVLIADQNDPTIINTVTANLKGKGCELEYLDGGFAAWKRGANPTISSGDTESFTDQAKVTYINSDGLKKKLDDKDPSLFVIDVRNAAAFQGGHIAGAKNIPLDELEKRRAEIPSAKTLVPYDNDVLGGFKAAVRLFDLGFPSNLVLSDGLDGWKKKGYPTEQ